MTASIEFLERKAFEIRRDIIKSLASSGSGHLGGSLGLADVFTTLYFSELNIRPEEPHWIERDRLVLSIGHVAPVLYAALAHAGYFEVAELSTLRKLDSRLQGHPGRDHGLPGLELSAGSLGQGLSVAVGMALAGKHMNANWRVYCVLGDGELQEGSIWEAAMSGAHHGLSNLMALVDRNGVQIDGPTETVMGIEPLYDKWKAFGWHVEECDGHDVEALLKAFSTARSQPDSPTVILAHTLMGKGVTSIEGDFHWHGRAPSLDQADDFIRELEINYGYDSK